MKTKILADFKSALVYLSPKTNKLKQADHKPNGLRQLTVHALVPQAGMPLIKTTSFS